jgi:hypothetical protein
MGLQAFVPTDKPSRSAYMKKHQGKNEKTPGKYGLQVFLRSVHPDVAANPVVVEICKDNMLLKKIILKSRQWKKIIFDENEINDSKVLGFRVSRTWNPSRLGISEDARDLGVAVVYKYGVVDKN